MADCTCVPIYLDEAAQRAMSPRVMDKAFQGVCAYWVSFPCEVSRKNAMADYARSIEQHARRLIWC